MYVLRKEDFDVDRDRYIIDDVYDIHSAIILNNIGRPKYTYIDGEKSYKKCRFCGKTQDEVTFDNKSHVVPKFLGNFLVISNFECDKCNSFFSKYETELEKFIKIPLIANIKDKDLKDRYGKNISRVGDDIVVSGEKEKVEFNGLYVLKILLKFAYSMLYDEEVSEYTNIGEVLLNDKVPRITHILDITLRKPLDWNSIILYKSKTRDYIDNIMVLNFNMKKYIVFFNKDDKNDTIVYGGDIDKYIKLFYDSDIYNHRVRDFESEHISIKFKIDIFMQFIKHGIY